MMLNGGLVAEGFIEGAGLVAEGFIEGKGRILLANQVLFSWVGLKKIVKKNILYAFTYKYYMEKACLGFSGIGFLYRIHLMLCFKKSKKE